MSALWAGLPVPVFLLGQGGAVRRANPAAEAALGVSERGLRGAAIADLLGGGAALEAALARFRAKGGALVLADHPLRLGGGERRATLRLVPWEGGGLMTLDLAPASPPPAGQAARSAIGLAEMLSHEIKNPLAGISGAAQLLAASAPPEDRQLADLIRAEAERIAALVDRVEAFGSRIAAQPVPVNLHDGLDRARRAALLGFAAHMRIEEIYDPSLPLALADPDQLQQILLNLLKNAAEAAPQGGQIRLRSFYDAGLRLGARPLPLHVEISDDGPGLPPDIAGQIFDPFVSGRENGTGLGLALVSKLMQDNGGMVSVERRAGATCFRLSFPRAAEG